MGSPSVTPHGAVGIAISWPRTASDLFPIDAQLQVGYRTLEPYLIIIYGVGEFFSTVNGDAMDVFRDFRHADAELVRLANVIDNRWVVFLIPTLQY